MNAKPSLGGRISAKSLQHPIAALAAGFLLSTSVAFAGQRTHTWDGGGANDNWTNGVNWVGDTVRANPDANDNLQFAGSARLNPVNDFAAGTVFRSITFNSGAGAFTLTGNSLAIANAAGIANNSSNLQTVSLDGIVLNAGITIAATSGSLTVNSPISGANTLTTTAGTGNKVTLTGGNGYTGAATVSTGTLNIQNSTALGTIAGGVTISDGATLELQGGISVGAEALSLRGSGVGGNGALRNISGANSWAGDITLSNNTQVHRINSDAGTLTISGGISETGNSNNKDLTFGGAGNITVSGVITSTAGGTDMRVFKDGAGNLNLTNANTYDGTTTISGGTLFANNAGGSATGTASVDVQSGGILGGSGFIAPTGANGISVSGVLAPGGALNTIGTLTLNMGGTTGTVAMNSGAGFEFLLGVAGLNISSVGASDMLAIAGAAANDFAFSGNSVDFLNSGAIGFYKLFDTSSNNANTWTGLTFDSITGVVSSGLTYGNLAGGYTGTFIVGTASNGGTTGDIYFQVVPEPRAALLGALGTLLLLRRRRAGLNPSCL